MKHRTQSEEKELFIRNGFSAITKENLEDIYNRRYNRFKFDNSDEVKIDGIIQSKEEKTLIKLSNYIIVPTPKEVFVSDLLNGFEITEKKFIEKELIILNNFQYDLLDLKNRIQLTSYKEYLSNRNSEAKFTGEYPYPFLSTNAYDIFKEIVNQFKNDETKNVANYSYVYWRMEDEGLIHVKSQKPFRDRLKEKRVIIDGNRLHAKCRRLGNLDSKELNYEKAIKIIEDRNNKTVS